MGEPDGSSFPTGGLRATHIARGYTCWDPSSPPFIMENNNGATLYIPCCFFSWDHGKALDEKIPLLRSEVALKRETLRLMAVLNEHKHVKIHMDAGLEQEFFLIDRKYFLARPDLMACGRTVIGCAPPKGQELEDQYFGAISTRFLDCLHEFEVECYKLGIPLQTRHREVAPGQYEIAPKFAPGQPFLFLSLSFLFLFPFFLPSFLFCLVINDLISFFFSPLCCPFSSPFLFFFSLSLSLLLSANVGTDRNLILMELLRKVARKHQLACLLHEKPFANVNGSGKHNNWSVIKFLLFLCFAHWVFVSLSLPSASLRWSC